MVLLQDKTCYIAPNKENKFLQTCHAAIAKKSHPYLPLTAGASG